MTQQLIPYATNGAAAAPVTTPAFNLGELTNVGKLLAESGFFSDAKGAAQAVAKVLAGAELGVGPVASMTGVNIINGKIALSANLVAALIRKSRPRYDYKILRLDNTGCEIAFLEFGHEAGRSVFTLDDAKAAGLAGGNWAKYPRNMVFSRAMTNGARWHCPDIFVTGVYTADELGADIDGETGELLPTVVAPSEAPDPTRPQPRMTQAGAIAAPDPQAALKRFWQRAVELGYVNAEGKLKKSAVHAAFGVAAVDGALEQYRQARGATWAEFTEELERSTAARATAETDPDALPFDPPAERCPTCGTETVDGECGACGMHVDAAQGQLLDAAPAQAPASRRGAH